MDKRQINWSKKISSLFFEIKMKIHSFIGKQKLYRQQTTFFIESSILGKRIRNWKLETSLLFSRKRKGRFMHPQIHIFFCCVYICKNRKILQNCVVFKDFVYLSLHPGLCPWIFFIFFWKEMTHFKNQYNTISPDFFIVSGSV